MPQYINFKATRYSFYQDSCKDSPTWRHVIGPADLSLTFVMAAPDTMQSIILARGPIVLQSINLLELPENVLRVSFRRPWVGFKWTNMEKQVKRFQIQATRDYDSIMMHIIPIANLRNESHSSRSMSGSCAVSDLSTEFELKPMAPPSTGSVTSVLRPQSTVPPIIYNRQDSSLILDIEEYSFCNHPLKAPSDIQPILHWQHLTATSGLQLYICWGKLLKMIIFRNEFVIDDIPVVMSRLRARSAATSLALKYRNAEDTMICRRQLVLNATNVQLVCQILRDNDITVSTVPTVLNTESTRITSHVSSPWEGT